MDASISRSDDVSETTQDSSFHLPPSLKKTLMKGVSPLGPNALPPKTTFGATSKLESLSPQDRKVDHFSMVRHVESWKKYNELGQTIPRQKIATTYGKLLDTPGPADYHPDRTVLSIDESGPKISLHSRVSANIVDKLETPGPGAYNLKATIEPPVELAKGARKTRLITRSPSKPMKGMLSNVFQCLKLTMMNCCVLKRKLGLGSTALQLKLNLVNSSGKPVRSCLQGQRELNPGQ